MFVNQQVFVVPLEFVVRQHQRFGEALQCLNRIVVTLADRRGPVGIHLREDFKQVRLGMHGGRIGHRIDS